MGNSLVNDEYPLIPIPPEPGWSENYVVNIYDPDQGIGGVFSIGRWVVRNKFWRSMICINLPGDRALVSRNLGEGTDPKVPDSGLFRIEILEPRRKLRYVFDGPMEERSMSELNTKGLRTGKTCLVQMDIIFESDDPLWDMHASDDAAVDDPDVNFNSPGGHIEQNGIVGGSLKIGDDEVYSLTAVATRDHSRGARSFKHYKSHLWTNGIFPSGRSFNMFLMTGQQFEGVAGRAAATIDGKVHDMTLAEGSQIWLDAPGKIWLPPQLIFESGTLGRMEIEGVELIGSIPLMLMEPTDMNWGLPAPGDKTPWINEQNVKWIWNGETGYGHLERGNTSFSSTDPAWLANFAA